MTDEEKAEKKYQEHINKENCYVSKSDEKIYTDGFLDGLAEGKPKWHDLRKDSNDLPKENGKYIVYIKVSERMSITDTCDFFNGYFGLYINPVAWCELPKFEE